MCLCDVTGSSNKKFTMNHHDILRTQPDVTHTVVTIQNQHTLDKPNNNHLYGATDHNSSTSHSGTLNGGVGGGGGGTVAFGGSSILNASFKTNNDHIYSNIDTLEKDTASMQKSLQRLIDPTHCITEQTGLLSEARLSDCETRPNSVYSACPGNRQSVVSCQLPHNIDVEALAVATVGHNGARLALPDSGL